MRRFVAIALSSTLMLQAAPLLAAPPTRAVRAGGAQAVAGVGGIYGTAMSAAGRALPKYTVQVRDLQTGDLAGTTTSDDRGRFAFFGLNPGNYAVELVSPAGVIVGTSASIAVAAGVTATVAVSATAVAAVASASGAGISTALLVTTIAAAAGIAGVVVLVKKDASPSE